MNITTIVASIATLTATSTAAMADTSFSVSGSVSASVSFGQTHEPVRVYRPQQAVQPIVIRDHRRPSPPIYNPRPTQTEPSLTYVSSRPTVLATAHLGGTKQSMDSETFNLRDYRGIDTVSFGWVYGNTAIGDVIVRYRNGESEVLHMGDPLTQNAAARSTRTVDVANRPIDSITVTGFGFGSQPTASQFKLIVNT